MPAEIRPFIENHEHFLVVGHLEPDGDFISSQILCSELLSALGKTTSLHSAGPFERTEIAAFSERFSTTVPRELLESEGTALVVLDCSGFDRLGSLGAQLEGLPCMVIDHHAAGTDFGDVRYVVPTSPATTMLVFSLFEEFEVVPSAEQARLLLFGLATDSGFFRHLRENSGETLRAVARLADLGTSPAEVFPLIYGGRRLENRKLLARMIESTESHLGDRILFATLTLDDKRSVSLYQQSDDDLYHLLQTVLGNEVVVLIKEEESGVHSVGLRSARLDVGAVARSFGGGGHRCAAGFNTPETPGKIKQLLLGVLSPLIDGPFSPS